MTNDASRSIAITLNVNSEEKTLSVDPRHSLADVLRDRFFLTGLHLGCEQGACGACTVLIDGEPALSCLALAVEAQGSRIQTVEHLSGPATQPGAMEKSFIEHGAFQCGFCTSGFLVLGHYIVDNGLGMTRESVRECLSGNICRCTGYEPIIDAITAVASGKDAQ